MPEQQPSIGRIVIYRNRLGVDMPAIITALGTFPGYVHLCPFPPPGAAVDILSYEHGTTKASPDNPEPESWRWPERVG